MDTVRVAATAEPWRLTPACQTRRFVRLTFTPSAIVHNAIVRRRLLSAFALLFAAVWFTPALRAQAASAAKKVLGVDDYARWRAIEGAQISPDGRWVASTHRLSNVLPNDSKPVLHLRNLETDQEVEIANASNATFSNDSRWIVYQVDSMPARPAARSGRPGADSANAPPAVPPAVPTAVSAAVPPAAPPATPPGSGLASGARASVPAAAPQRRYELRELATGTTRAWKDVQSATFAATSSHLLLRRRAVGAGASGASGGPGGPGGFGQAGGDAGASATAPRGVDVLLVELASGRAQMLGSVGDMAFNRQGDLLGYTVDAAVADGNGFVVIDLVTGRPWVLDNDAKRYARIAWSADGNGVAVLKGSVVEKMRERENVLVAFPDVRAAMRDGGAKPALLDPAKAPNWEKGWVLSERAPLAWSENKRLLFFGAKAQVAPPDTAKRASTDSVADVDVWRTEDTRIQSAQMIRAEQERNFTYRQAIDVVSGTYVRLADTTMRQLDVSLDGRWAVGIDARAYVSDWKPATADLYRVNTATGERTLMLTGHVIAAGGLAGFSSDGRNFLFWKDNKYHAYDLAAGTSRVLGGTSAPSFVDTEDDHPGPKPPVGLVGYTPDGTHVVVEQRFDIWLLALDGTTAQNLTQGAGTRDEKKYRWVRTDIVDPTDPQAERKGREIDITKPLTFATYGEYTKKAGFARLADGKLADLVYDDAAYGVPVRAAKTDRYLFTRQTFVEFPDLRFSGPDFANAKRITNANPQQAEYQWGRRVLFDFKNSSGKRLQGILALPEDYKSGAKLPMIVSFYEKNSQNMHRYLAPSFITGMGSVPMEAVSRGYIAMIPDVHFRTGNSHSDMLDCVEAATRKVIALGYADPKHIAVHGHSYGGEGAAFIGTRSRLFAAVGMGAGVTDLFSDFNQSWGWTYQVSGGSGENGNQYYMYGQGRWGFSPWDKPDKYRFESALAHAPEVTAPFLIMHGTADPTVSFTEGMNFYNALRYNGKNAVLLAYPGEGHGLRGLANRRDLTIRYFQFFDHYLKGTPAPKWMTDGVPFLAKDANKAP